LTKSRGSEAKVASSATTVRDYLRASRMSSDQHNTDNTCVELQRLSDDFMFTGTD
jgi:hypothetical protein